MLVIKRRRGEQVWIDDICVTVRNWDRGRVVLVIEAPKDKPVMRGELRDGWKYDKSSDDKEKS